LRASSLSNPKIIELLNAYFVPVHLDGTYVQAHPETMGEELAAYRGLMAEMHRVNKTRQTAGQEKLSIGTVHAYVLSPDGQAVDSRHVAHAGPESVIKMLNDAIKTHARKPGKPLVALATQSPRPEAPADALVLHLTSRYLVSRNDGSARKEIEGEFVPRKTSGLGGERSGQWDALPSEDWLVLQPEAWRGLLPEGTVGVADTWQVKDALVDTLLTRFYPTTEENDLSRNRIDERSLKITVLSVEGPRVRARIDGHLNMKHSFTPGREDNRFVHATVEGVMAFDAKQIHDLQLVTTKATYGDEQRAPHFGVALRRIP
jgi:hypothetical protein